MRRFVIPYRSDDEQAEILRWMKKHKVEIVHRSIVHYDWDDQANNSALLYEAVHIRTQDRPLQLLMQLRYTLIGADRQYFERQKDIDIFLSERYPNKARPSSRRFTTLSKRNTFGA